MTYHHNPIGDLVDEAVDVLTRLAHLTDQMSKSTGQAVGFADRVADVLTHVAANLRGIAHLTTDSSISAGDLLRGLIELSTDSQDLIAWRTTPILVRPVDPDQVPLHAPAPPDSIGLARWRQDRQASLDAHQDALLETMRRLACDLGYNAELRLAQHPDDLDPGDAQLIKYLNDTAQGQAPPPTDVEGT